MRSSRYEARRKFGEHERCSGLLSALQTSRVLHNAMKAQLTYEPIVLEHFQAHGLRNGMTSAVLVLFFSFSFRSIWGVKNSIPKEKVGSSFSISWKPLRFASWFPTLISCSPNLPRVYIRLCKHGNHFTFLQ